MSFKTLKVKVTFDMVVREELFENMNQNVAYEMAHKIRVALMDSKDYMITNPLVEAFSEKK